MIIFFPANFMSSTYTDKNNPFSRCTYKQSQVETVSQTCSKKTFSNCLSHNSSAKSMTVCENPDTIQSSLLMPTWLDLVGSSIRIAHRSSCVHRRPLLCQSEVKPHTALLSGHARSTKCRSWCQCSGSQLEARWSLWNVWLATWKGRETLSTSSSSTMRLANVCWNSMGVRTVTGLVRWIGSRNRVACFSLTEHHSMRSADDSQWSRRARAWLSSTLVVQRLKRCCWHETCWRLRLPDWSITSHGQCCSAWDL